MERVKKSSGEIEQLTPLEHVRRRTMWTGARTFSTQILLECLENCLDECLSGYSNKLEIDKKDDYYIVRDYGRGIPLTSTKMPGKDVPVEICTQLFSGGKFESDGLYSFAVGQNGIGLLLVNALSSKFYVTTRFNNKFSMQYEFENGIFKGKSKIPYQEFSTEFKFIPDPQYFESVNIEENVILERLKAAKNCLNESVKLFYCNEEITTDLMTEFMCDTEEIVTSSTENKVGEECKVFIGLVNDENEGKQFQGVVNLVPTIEGTNSKVSAYVVKNLLLDVANKKKMSIKYGDDLLVPIKLMVILKLKKPEFDSQVKRKFISKRETFEPLISKCVESIIKNNPEFVQLIIQRAEDYRVQIESNRNAKKRKIGRNSVIVKGLFECMDKGNDCDLFLIEGESAGGNLIRSRDPKKHAILALRGKVLNVGEASKEKILKNEVINNICAALGYKPFQEIDPEKCRYGRVIIAADADQDAYHIINLLVTMFYVLMPELIKSGKIYVVNSPLFGYTEKGKFIPIYDNNEAKRLIDNGKKINRFKGLGEMDPHELYCTAIDPTTRHLFKVIWEDFDLKKEWPDFGRLLVSDYEFNERTE